MPVHPPVNSSSPLLARSRSHTRASRLPHVSAPPRGVRRVRIPHGGGGGRRPDRVVCTPGGVWTDDNAPAPARAGRKQEAGELWPLATKKTGEDTARGRVTSCEGNHDDTVLPRRQHAAATRRCAA